MSGTYIQSGTFENKGGWIVETQSVRHIGGAYLMAHGYGVPVADAVTHFTIAESAEYEVLARTRNWVEEWSPGRFPGRFRIAVDGEAQPFDLGTNGKEWAWQSAGKISLKKGVHLLSLEDLTGFNGRCESVAFVRDGGAGEAERLRLEFVSRPVVDAGKDYDLIVIGGGVAGTCAAISAARSGITVLALQDRSVLGGCNSSEVRVGMGGVVGVAPYPNLGRVVREIEPLMSNNDPLDARYYEDDRKSIAFDTKTKYYCGKWCVPGVAPELKLGQYVESVEMTDDGKSIAAVIALDVETGVRTRYRAKFFCDASGDAVVARLAGCETMYGTEARDRFHEASAPVKAVRQVMGMTIQWKSEERDSVSPFPDISDWALHVDDDSGAYRTFGTWDQESGFFRDMADDTEAIRDYGLLAVFSNWNWMKNYSPRKSEFDKTAFNWISPVGGKRESYRVVGDHIFNQNDLHNQIEYDDGTASATWNIDFHFPDPRLEGKFPEPIRSAAYHRGFGGKPVAVPLRSLYARDCDNLFLVGRHISVSHAAFACVRVMRTLGALAEAVGIAAALCVKHCCKPRDIRSAHLDEFKNAMKAGVPPLPTFHPGGYAIEESYHFNSRGWTRISPAEKGTLSDGEKSDIAALDYEHMNEHPDLQEKRRILVLADESRSCIHYYDSFSYEACFSIPVDKPVRDLKKVGDGLYRIVCNGGFQTVSLAERKIVDEFKPALFDDYQTVSCCDLADGGFVFCVNSAVPCVSKGVCFFVFSQTRECRGIVKLEDIEGSSSMRKGRDGEWLVAHNGGFARIRLDFGTMKSEVVADYPRGTVRRIFDVCADPISEGYIAGCGRDGIKLFDNVGKLISSWNVPTDTGKESCFCAQVTPVSDGHVYLAHWAGYLPEDSFKAWQVIEFDHEGKAVWHLDSPDRYGSVSGVCLVDC